MFVAQQNTPVARQPAGMSAMARTAAMASVLFVLRALATVIQAIDIMA